MTKRPIPTALLLAEVLLLAMCSTHAHAGLANAPWPMFRHDLSHTGVSPYHDPTPTGAYWKYSTGAVFSSCAIGSDGTIYVDGGSYLYALNGNGTLKWKTSIGVSTRSSAAISDDGTIYVGSGDYRLYAINPDGSVKWTFLTGNQISSSPAIAPDGTVYVGSIDGKLYAVNPDGTQKWAFACGSGIQITSPAIGADGTIYIGCSGSYLFAINPDGTEKWRYGTGQQILSSPAISPDGSTVYIVGLDGYMYALSTAGSLRWRSPIELTLGNTPSSPAVAPDGTVYVGSHTGILRAITPAGSEIWRFETGSDIRSSAAISADGTIYISCWDGSLYAVNPDGTEKWDFVARSSFYASPAIASDGTIVLGSLDGYVYGGLNSSPPTTSPPTNLTATVIGGLQVRLAWQDHSSDEWGFRIERRTIPDVAFTRIGSTAANVTSFDDTSPKSGMTYGYRVCAYQQGGNSAYSNEAMVTMAGVGAPTDLVATAVSRTQADLSWTDRASNETGFRIERRTGLLGDFGQIAVLGPDADFYSDTSGNPATTYSYRVCAFNNEGSSDYSNEATVALGQVGMPTDLTATAVSGTQVDLSWTDRAWDETGFRIERMAGPFGSFRQIAVLGPDADFYSDKSVSPATTYYYRVCAFDNESCSDYSNEAWALTNGMDFTEILRGNTTRKQMALTFDCGVTPILPGILQILRERGVYATFFVTGVVAQQVPGSVLDIVADGHVIGNHTYNHPLLTTVSDEEVVSQLQLADDIIYGICGHRTRPFFRPPSGQRDARVLAAAQSAGFRSVCWTAGGGDYGGWTTQQIIDDTFNNAKNGGVMLYHASVANTEAALPTIIDGLRAQGYELVTVPEIIAPEIISSPPDAVCPGWNLISIPCEIACTNPQVVFRGVPIDGRLYRWDRESASQIMFDSWSPSLFGPVSPDEGYWLWLDEPATLRVAGRQPTADRHNKLPQGPTDPVGGMSIVGSPFNTPREWADCTIYNPAFGPPGGVPLADAVELGWVPCVFFWWDAATQSQYDAGAPEYWPYSTQILPWHGYFVDCWQSGLELIIPKP